MGIQPLGEFVLIVPDVVENKTRSGLIVTGKINEGRIKYGKVCAVGPGLHNGPPMDISVGDTVAYPIGGYDEIITPDGIGHITRQSSLLAKITIDTHAGEETAPEENAV